MSAVRIRLLPRERRGLRLLSSWGYAFIAGTVVVAASCSEPASRVSLLEEEGWSESGGLQGAGDTTGSPQSGGNGGTAPSTGGTATERGGNASSGRGGDEPGAGGADESGAGGASAGASASGGKAGAMGKGGSGGAASAGKGGSSGMSATAGAPNAGTGGTEPKAGGLKIEGRTLKDPCGETVTMRGYEQQVHEGLLEADAGIPEMAKTGANYARLLVQIPPHEAGIASVNALSTYIELARENEMFIELALDDGSMTDSVYDRPEVKVQLLGSEDVVLVTAVGEATEANDSAWVTQSKAAVSRLRGYGYEHVLMVGSRVYGREPNTVLSHGAEVVAADPKHNVHFFVQLFWGENAAGRNYYETEYAMTITQALERFAASDVAIQSGIVSDDSCCGEYPWIDFEAAMTTAQAEGVSWLWRDWYNPSDTLGYHLTTDGKYGSWQSNPGHPKQPDHGNAVTTGHAASVKNTSVRTRYLRTHACQ